VDRLFRALERPRPPVRCRTFAADLNPVAAGSEDDRAVFCLACLAHRPDASFGEQLRALRVAAGLSQVELGQRAGLSHSTVSKLESDRMRPRRRTQGKLSRVLGVLLVLDPFATLSWDSLNRPDAGTTGFIQEGASPDFLPDGKAALRNGQTVQAVKTRRRKFSIPRYSSAS
jgi:transcriptional regulator with XRE-family HTH domain